VARLSEEDWCAFRVLAEGGGGYVLRQTAERHHRRNVV